MHNERLSSWARLYVTTVTVLGAAAIAQSAYALYAVPLGWNWFVLAILTLISGSATVKLPSVPATISVSETFVFTSVLLFGPAAGTITVALDALVISLWLARRGHPFYRIAFNVCALPASLWLGAHLFYWMWDSQPLSLVTAPVAIGGLIQPLIFFTVSYFLLNSWLIAFAISLEKHLAPLRVWRENFAWLSLNYFGGASVAALLATYTRNIDYAYLAFVLPLLAVLYFTFSMSMGRVEDANRHLRELNRLYISTIETLAMAIDAKDQITHGHIRRVQRYATGLAKVLGVTDAAQLSAIEAASLLHDMGKLAVPEYILNKPGPLTPAEFEKMKLHASVGADILSAIDFPYPVVPIVRHHHENWGGGGYPDGIKGSDIPLGARILSVVDCFDALTSDRPYRPRLSDSDAIAILVQRRGSMYDPLIVDTFIAVHAQLAPEPSEQPGPRNETITTIARGAGPAEPLPAVSPLEDIASSSEETLVLYDLARALTGYLDLRDAGDIIAKHIRRVVPVSACVFYIYDPATDELEATHVVGENAASFAGIRIPRGQRLSGWVAANKQTIVNSEPVLDLGEVARTMRPRLRSCLSTPLLIEGDLLGVLTIYANDRNAFTENHRRVIEAVARQVAHTIRQTLGGSPQSHDANPVVDRSSLLSAHDLDKIVASELSDKGRQSRLSLIFIHVNTSKVAKQGRHSEHCSQDVASATQSIRRAMRAGNLLFRHRDSDFVVLLTHTDFDAAAIVASRIATSVGGHSAASSNITNDRVQVTLSIATAPTDGITVSDLASAALSRETLGPFTVQSAPSSVH
jgi:putative nucleotidyltransferase with HDIG domain